MFRFVLFASLAACAFASAPRLVDQRIVGGEATTIEEFPYQVSLLYANSHICGGSIISEDWVLTAAHCVNLGTGYDNSRLSIRVGSSTRNSGGSVHAIASIISHANYNDYTLDNDVAVIKVSTPFTFSNSIAAITLVSTAPADGADAIVTGWGTLSSGGSSPSQLQKVTVPIVAQSTCESRYSWFGTITETMICAGYTEGGKDACQGDSGGPLAVDGELVGVVSWGFGCAVPYFPGVYARVNYFRSWITEQTGV